MKALPRSVLFAAVAALVLSLSYAFYYHDRPRVDAKAYDTIAWNMASGYGYVEHRELAAMPEKDDAVVRVGPGYQFFLAGVYSIVGHHIWVVWVLHALLRAMSVLLIALIFLYLWPTATRGASIAAWLFAISPDLTVVSGLLLTETLFLFLLLGALYASLRALDGDARDVLTAGCVWALTVLVRPTALFGLFVFIGFHLVRKQYLRALLAFVGMVVIVGPWSYNMSTRYDAFILTTTAGGYDLWVGNNPDATGGFVKTPEMQALREVTHSVELDKRGKQEYFSYLWNEPIDFALLQLQKTAQYFSLARPTGFWIHLIAHPVDRLVTASLSFLWTMVLMIGGVAAAWSLWRKRMTRNELFVFLVAIVQPLAVIPIIVETRYRYALYPFLALFFGWGASIGNTSRKIIGSTAAAFVLIACIDVAIHFEDLSGKLEQLLRIF